MRDLNDLYFFVQVVDHGGFAPAGRALGIPKSKLSRRIALLEESLDVRLLQRSSRRFAVTEIGQEYYARCQAMLVEADSAQEVVDRTQETPQGMVRLSCPLALLDYQVADMLARFMVQHPRIQLQIQSTNRRVDVIREGLDIALRVRFPPLEDSDLVMKTLGESTQFLVASPQLVAAMGGMPQLADLAQWPSLGDGQLQRSESWLLQGPQAATAEVHHQPRMVCEDRIALLQAALHGVGVVQLPAMMILEELRSGRLVDVMPGWKPRAGIVHAVFPSRRGLLPSVRLLLDFLGAEFAALQAQIPQT
ncbi:LysR substrate-binding domain-containing protein [Comamonas sp. GB3 AK4-5]|uniref:LysR substrate-binding domain-containing protein n=1 Tax=Comamonas sp. GB3 AK4-5 TaxID=3231487 RepID=UPI00351ED3C9